MDAGQRMLAIGAVVALHAAVIGGFIQAQLHPPAAPPEKTLSVSFITEAAASAAPAPAPPPPPPPPKAEMMATTSPTPSPMSAPPMERQPERMAPTPPAPPSPQVPAAAPSNAPVVAATTPPNFTAAYLNNPGPAYPMASRRRHEEGVVRLRVQVSAEGAPTQVLIERSSGSTDLDTAAQEVVKKRWKFAPAKQGDRAVPAWVIVPMEFSLKNR